MVRNSPAGWHRIGRIGMEGADITGVSSDHETRLHGIAGMSCETSPKPTSVSGTPEDPSPSRHTLWPPQVLHDMVSPMWRRRYMRRKNTGVQDCSGWLQYCTPAGQSQLLLEDVQSPAGPDQQLVVIMFCGHRKANMAEYIPPK